MFLALRKKTHSPVPSGSNVQSEPNQICSYAQAVKTPQISLQNVNKRNNAQMQSAAQAQQTNDILGLKNMIKHFLARMDTMLNALTAFITKTP